MIKDFVTRNQIRENYTRILYAENPHSMYHLLIGKRPIACNVGKNGVNFDLFDIEGTALLIGYRNMIGTPINPIEAEKKAEAIWNNTILSEDFRKEIIDTLLWAVINGGTK